MRRFRSFALLALLALCALPAKAELRRFRFDYSGIPNGNKAKAVGYIAVDDSALANPGSNEFPSTPWVKEFRMTVSGATNKTHNGTFLASDLANVRLDFEGGAIDLDSELVGQPEPFHLNIVDAVGGALAPTGVVANQFRTGGGAGELLDLASLRPLNSTNLRVYRCTLSVKGAYKYCDRDFAAPGVPRWVCKQFAGKDTFFLALDPAGGEMAFFWIDEKGRRYQFRTCTLPALNLAQCKPPTASNPAGTWELCLPLWSHSHPIDLDPPSGTPDATRCRIVCLSGTESTVRLPLPFGGVTISDQGAATLAGSFYQVTCYDTQHYAFGDPTKDTLLSWSAPLRPGPAIAWLTGTLSCKLDTQITGLGIESGDSLASTLDQLFGALDDFGFTQLPPLSCGPDPATPLAITGGEVLELLAP